MHLFYVAVYIVHCLKYETDFILDVSYIINLLCLGPTFSKADWSSVTTVDLKSAMKTW